MSAFLTRDQARRAERPDLFGLRRGLPEATKQTVRDMIASDFTGFSTSTGTPSHDIPLRDRWNLINSWDNSISPTDLPDPWYIVGGYSADPVEAAESTYNVEKNLRPMADLAFKYQIFGDEEDAAAACRIIDGFASISDIANVDSGNTFLSWTDHWPVILQAAEYVQESDSYTTSLNSRLEAQTEKFRDRLSTAYTFHHQNNWIAWGLNAEFACAGFLKDKTLHDRAVYRWQQYFIEGVKSDFLVDRPLSPAHGTLKDNVIVRDVYREGGGQGNGSSGLLYSNYALNGMVMAAEWARHNGTWLYDHVSPDGSSLKGLWETVTYQSRYAGGYPTGGSGAEIPRTEILWYNISEQEGNPSRYYWNRTYGFYNVLQNLWPNDEGGFFIEANRANAKGGFQPERVIPHETSPERPDPWHMDNDVNGIRNMEFTIRVPGLWAEDEE